MKVVVAGASGAVGVPLTRALVARGHEVLGLSRTAVNRGRLRELGAEPVIADVMDRPTLLHALYQRRADAVVHQLTALKRPPVRHRDLARTDALREDGTANLLAAADAIGASLFVTQSFFCGYGYGDWGTRVLTEEDTFGPAGRTGWLERHIAAMRSAEYQAFTGGGHVGIEGIALRYGAFYGPGAGTERMVELLRRHLFPLPSGGGGVVSLIHIEDAASATVAALERGALGQAYNVVDDQPVSWGQFAGELARAFGTPKPVSLPRWLFRPATYAYEFLGTTLRLSNAKAKEHLGWEPAFPTYRDGIRALARAEAGSAGSAGSDAAGEAGPAPG